MNIQELAKKADDEADRLINMPGEYHPDWHDVRDSIFAALVLEEAAKVCDERAMKNERACDGLDDEDATSLRSAAWQMSVCAASIRALKGAKE